MKTLEQRIARAERVLKMFVRRGRQYRKQFREDIEILIHTQMRDNEEWRARHRAMDEKINILIDAQIATEEQLKRTDEQIKETDEQIKATDEQIKETDEQIKRTNEQIEALTARQVKTDQALERFLNGLSKGRNGNSSD